MSKVVVDQIERTKEYTSFIKELNLFHQRKGTTLRSEPVLGGKKIDLYKLYKEVLAGGGYNQVTKSRTWKHIGDSFNFPSTCTNSAYILKGVYARNLLGFEEEKVWGEEWIVPEELKGPDAHKLSTLAGKSYKYCKHHNPRHLPYKPIHSKTILLPSLTTRSNHTCEISETHHKTLPTEHIHSTDDANDCLTGNEFDEQRKSQVIQSLRSDNATSLEWALNKIVTVSYESPQKLLLVENPILLEFLLEKADQSVENTLFHHTSQTPNYVLKILHIFRNFSFIESNIKVFATNKKVKQLLIKCLILTDAAYYSHCIDVLENMAPFIELGPFDPIIGCLTNLLLKGTERSVILGSVRILTLLANNDQSNNMFYLLLTSENIANRITELLVVNDEELIGASLEYLYHYSKQSTAFSQYLLNLHHGADIGIMVSLLMTPFKYFRPVIVQPNQDSPKISAPTPSTTTTDLLQHHHQHHSNEPCIPNLTFYQQLDEPYRCLGWLKDKFELGPQTSELSMDDMYLLYEMRFGHEKALKMRDFYTVLKIAFPIVTQAIEEQQNIIKLEGTTIRGLQVKMCILQDGSELMCQWNDCSKEFSNEQLLQNHILHDHASFSNNSNNNGDGNNCQWMNCDSHDVVDLNTHIRHDHLAVDMSDIQGVALVSARLLQVLSRHPHSHGVFIPYESELISMMTKRPKLEPYIESIFANFEISCPSSSNGSSTSCSPLIV